MTVISMANVSKTYGEKVVLDQVSLQINEGDKVGLVGANGSGKSTILNMLTHSVEPDDGQITWIEGLEVGYLTQVLAFRDGEVVEEWLLETQRDFRWMEKRMQECMEQMGTCLGHGLDRVLADYGDLCTRFEQRGGYELPFRIDTVMHGLGLSHLSQSRLLSTLSGGEKTRLGLASLLIRAPDVLLLDEPTNHLDSEIMAWLEQYLIHYNGTLLVVSHDRQFLNQAVNRILEVDEYDHQVRTYSGNYSAYEELKRLEQVRWAERYQTQQEEIRRLQERIHEVKQNSGHIRPTKDNNKMAYNRHGHSAELSISRNVKAAQTQLDRILEHPIPPLPEPLQFHAELDSHRIHRHVALSVSNLSVTGEDDGFPILNHVRFTLGRNEHMLITGPNGAGKTTLLDVLAGIRPADEGEVFIPSHLTIGYLPQEADSSHDHLTVLACFQEGLKGDREAHIAELLSYQLFRFAEFALPVRSLSPGQHRKLLLAKLMALRPGLLLVDEPTNHVGFDVLRELERALNDFPGPVIVISHDRWFIDHFTGERWTLERGVLSPVSVVQRTPEEEARLIGEIESLSQFPMS